MDSCGHRRLDRGLCRRHAGAEDDNIGARERGGVVPAKFKCDAGGTKSVFFRDGRLQVGQRHRRTTPRQQVRGRNTAAGGPNHRNLPPTN